MPALPSGSRLRFSDFERNLKADAETCDLSRLRFIDAYGIVGTACALLAASTQADFPRVLLPKAPQTRAHLAAMGFGEFLVELGERVALEHGQIIDRPDVLLPLSIVKDHGKTQELSTLLHAQVRDCADPHVLEALTEGLWELVANALEHSLSPAAVLMGQVYRGGEAPDHDDRVQVVIGDAGRGVRASFLDSGVQSPATDQEALVLACRYLVSSVRDPGRGQGLSTVVETVAGLKGRVALRSGEARLTLSRSGRDAETVPRLAGTVVGISLPLYPG
jgi:hypothetical protein